MTSENLQVRAGVYGRESQGKQGSIEGQLADGRAEADALPGWTVVDEYQDRVSASRYAAKPRVDWPRLVADVESGKINAVIIRDTSRADRRPARWIDFLDLCRDNGVLIRSVMKHKTYDSTDEDDYMALAQQGLRNYQETEQIRGRSRAGHRKGHRLGQPTGGRVQTGYRRTRWVEGTERKVTQEEDPTTAPLVRKAFKAIAGGTPIVVVSAETGWSPSRIRKMIRNKAYIGLRKWKDSNPTKAMWPALIDAETFRAANAALERNRQGWKPGRVQHWLSGAILCGVCDRPLVCRPMHTGKDLFVYSCKVGCVAVTAIKAEDYIFDEIVGKFADPNYRHELFTRAETGNAELAAISKELEEIDRQLRETRQAYRKRQITMESFTEFERGLTADRKAQERKRAAVPIPSALRVIFGDELSWDADSLTMTLPPEYETMDSDLLPHLERGIDFYRRWVDLSIPARRGVVRDLFEIRLLPVGKGQRVPMKDRVELHPR